MSEPTPQFHRYAIVAFVASGLMLALSYAPNPSSRFIVIGLLGLAVVVTSWMARFE